MSSMVYLDKLEKLLFVALRDNITDLGFRPEFDLEEMDLNKGNRYCVIQYTDDKLEGKVVSPLILHPGYKFTVYGQKYSSTRQALILLIDFFEGIDFRLLRETDWKVEWLYKEGQTAPEFDPDDRYYAASLFIRFHLTGLV